MKAFVFYLLLSTSFAFGQTQLGTTFKTGFNRIGLYVDQTLNFDLNNNQFDFGLRFYGPDFVFERDIIGLSIGYSHNFYTQNHSIYFGQ